MSCRSTDMESLFAPASIAVVGASAKGGAGLSMLERLRNGGFPGRVWPVSRSAEELAGYGCCAALSELPETPDCLLLTVPAPAVLGLLEEAAAIGIRFAVVVAEGFSDAGTPEGDERQRRVVELAERTGIRVVGPNSIGLASLPDRLVATLAEVVPETATSGSISVVSQSGGLLLAAAELCGLRGFGLNKLVSIGNQAVLEVSDYLDYLAADPGTRVIALILEGVGDGRRFRAALARATAKKPVVILKLGRSQRGSAATIAHTGTLAGSDEALVALCRRTGATLVDSLDQLVETAGLFNLIPRPQGRRVCLMTISGGATSMISDMGTRLGLPFAAISPETNTSLKKILEVERDFFNPVDTVGLLRLLKADNLPRLLDTLAAEPDADLIVLVMPVRHHGHPVQARVLQALCKAAENCRKPVVVISMMTNGLTGHWRGHAEATGLPLLDGLATGLCALRHLGDYAAHLQAEANAEPDGPAGTPRRPGAALSESAAKRILAEVGLPLPLEREAMTPEAAAEAVSGFGGAVAVKVLSPDIPHKSDVGGVLLNCHGPEEVAAAARRALDNARRACPEARIHGVLVQEMVPPSVEIILSMTYDDKFGPMVVVGAGGVAVEVFRDSTARLAPVTRAEAHKMLDELHIRRMLSGFRGAPSCDLEALLDCIVRFAEFAAQTDGRYATIELNPVIVAPDGEGLKIVDALVVPFDHAARETAA